VNVGMIKILLATATTYTTFSTYTLMNPETTRDITLRTLAGDVSAIAKNQRPEPLRVSLHVRLATEAPAQESGEAPAQPKKRSPLLVIVIVIFAVGALGGAGYLLYKNLTTPQTMSKTPVQ